MQRPRVKRYPTRQDGETLVLIRDPGVELELPDADGAIRRLIDLLDGTRTIDEAAVDLAREYPAIRPDEVAEAVTALDAAGLVEDDAATTTLTARQQERYFSNLAFFQTFADLGRSKHSFQERLRRSHVVQLGVGGFGSTSLYNLAGLGVGKVTIVDFDRVALKNFARQFLYSEAEIGLPKAERAAARGRAFNSEVEFVALERRIESPTDVAELTADADLVISAIDRPERIVHFWVNEACVRAGVPFVSGGLWVARGSYYSVDPGRSACLACGLVDEPLERPEKINRGLGPVATCLGGFVALEATRYLTGFAPPVAAGKMWIIDFATGQVEVGNEWDRREECGVCGTGERAAAVRVLATAS